MFNFFRSILSRRNTITMDMKSVYRRDVKRRGNGELLHMLADLNRLAVYCGHSDIEAAFWCRAGIIKAELRRRRAIVRKSEIGTIADYAETVW